METPLLTDPFAVIRQSSFRFTIYGKRYLEDNIYDN